MLAKRKREREARYKGKREGERGGEEEGEGTQVRPLHENVGFSVEKGNDNGDAHSNARIDCCVQPGRPTSL